MRQVVVTGAGIVSPIGNNLEEFQRRMFAGESGTVAIRGRAVAENFPVPVGAPVQEDAVPMPRLLRHLDPAEVPKFSRFAGAATEQAMAGLPASLGIDGVVYGGDYADAFDCALRSFSDFVADEFPWHAFTPEASLTLIREVIADQGRGHIADQDLISISNACVSGNQAIGIAFEKIRCGQWNRALAGGVWARCTPCELMNFHLLSTLTVRDGAPEEASRPFSRDRGGFVLGEGAATLVLEALDLAEERQAQILGGITGYASTSDSYRITDGKPDGKAAARAMQAAIAAAGITAGDISAISAHGTSTALNDRLETLAIKAVLGPEASRVPVISLKSQTGHSIVAAGALEAVASLAMLERQTLAPTINYREFDPDCDLDYVPNLARSARLSRILSNSFGFGGQNACVVLEASPISPKA